MNIVIGRRLAPYSSETHPLYQPSVSIFRLSGVFIVPIVLIAIYSP